MEEGAEDTLKRLDESMSLLNICATLGFSHQVCASIGLRRHIRRPDDNSSTFSSASIGSERDKKRNHLQADYGLITGDN